MGSMGNLGLNVCKVGENVRLDLGCISSTIVMCPNPTFPNRCLVLTLLTKCGVVVGVFGLGPKGRGLDSLHCVVLVVWVPCRVQRKN